MHTFLPYPDFRKSAEVLDWRRLGKQRVECKQLINALLDPTRKGWQNHPATNMWRGHLAALALYGLRCCEEWRRRGYQDSLLPFFEAHLAPDNPAECSFPPWLGREEVHASHRSNLLRKEPGHYRIFWPAEPDDLPYVWPKGDAA